MPLSCVHIPFSCFLNVLVFRLRSFFCSFFVMHAQFQIVVEAFSSSFSVSLSLVLLTGVCFTLLWTISDSHKFTTILLWLGSIYFLSIDGNHQQNGFANISASKTLFVWSVYNEPNEFHQVTHAYSSQWFQNGFSFSQCIPIPIGTNGIGYSGA